MVGADQLPCGANAQDRQITVQIAAGVRYWVDSPDGGPEDWGGAAPVYIPVP